MKFATGAVATLILALTAFHSAMVVVVNAPRSALTPLFHPLQVAYTGPWIEQGWTLFAPDVTEDNLHVYVRGHLSGGGADLLVRRFSVLS